ncbi:PLDc_N domain-containing protein [Actinobacteria bacterium YIM 96077]|uniref:Cardiolipin synthase N-terminal domain-containing protein n=1 Tax=Phytoactinopolyspora halophila TaxID=1981511 RepID=A0A329QL07_9ACTN|nr:PLD nuclease N-terminal domain-containing protein [Phytoactinopolyspora halophila]AYY14801.1 PLDc_N domain-containing protein [Actinobacteria bacterium YIM 96077]RAW13075.1 hypothetical protein DPM12_13435 [Phytoactinopolyspora halophila]
MTRVLPVVIALALAVYALIDCLQTDSSSIRVLNKIAWAAIILLIPVIGPILWLATAKRPANPRPPQPQPRPVAPDDDPEFLRELKNLDEEHEKLLNDWEDSLRRREENLRKREDGDAGTEGDQKPGNDDNSGEELRKRGDSGDEDNR